MSGGILGHDKTCGKRASSGPRPACCWISYIAQDSPTQQRNYLVQNVNSVGSRNPNLGQRRHYGVLGQLLKKSWFYLRSLAKREMNANRPDCRSSALARWGLQTPMEVQEPLNPSSSGGHQEAWHPEASRVDRALEGLWFRKLYRQEKTLNNQRRNWIRCYNTNPTPGKGGPRVWVTGPVPEIRKYLPGKSFRRIRSKTLRDLKWVLISKSDPQSHSFELSKLKYKGVWRKTALVVTC